MQCLGVQNLQMLHQASSRHSSGFFVLQGRRRCQLAVPRSRKFRQPRIKKNDTVAQSSSSEAGEVSGMAPELKGAVEEFLAKNKVVLFMKGTKQFPQCGFSNTCVQILNTMKVPYETINILEDESLRHGMKAYSQWPTFPQVYINSEFVGGCDIMIEAYQNGELQEMLEVAISS